MSIHFQDPMLENLTKVREQLESELGANDFVVKTNMNPKVNKEWHSICMYFTTPLTKWDVKSYKLFLEKIKQNVNCKYKFKVDGTQPCCWLYKDGYFYYTIWDYGIWYDSRKIKMSESLLSKLEAIDEVIKENK